MIKTVKVKKHMRLDELIKYVWDNNDIFKGRTHIKFTSNNSCPVIFGVHGHFETDYGHNVDDIFTVEVEEDITEDTWFRNLIQIYETVPGNARLSHWDDTTTKEIINWNENENTKKVYALIENKLQLIWEAE